MTNPCLLLADEPTSGLDSETAYQIVKLLKQEAKRGMTVLATIHQPSSDIFYTFDRVIVLAEGFTIYNGPTLGVKAFLESLGLSFGKYTNPSDLLLKLANDPSLIHQKLTLRALHQDCLSSYKPLNQKEKDYIFE